MHTRAVTGASQNLSRSSQGAKDRIRIAERAFALWNAAGQPPGRDMEFWLQAESQLEAVGRRGSRTKGFVETGGRAATTHAHGGHSHTEIRRTAVR